jgi:hypothetical protein
MPWPLSQDYNEAIQNWADGGGFALLMLQGNEACVGMPTANLATLIDANALRTSLDEMAFTRLAEPHSGGEVFEALEQSRSNHDRARLAWHTLLPQRQAAKVI